MPRIMISYRRDDSGVITPRIDERLTAHYGRDSVFRDVDSIPFGADFREHIARELDGSDAVLAIIGPRWVGSRGGRSRLEEETDFVRLEIETALTKQVPLVPVLVLGASMPKAQQLPESLKGLAYRHAVQIDADVNFDADIGRLIRAMDRILREATNNLPPLDQVLPPPSPTPADSTIAVSREALVPTELTPPAALPTPPTVHLAKPSHRSRRVGIAIGSIFGLVVGAVAAIGLFAVWRPIVVSDTSSAQLATTEAALKLAQSQSANQARELKDLKAAADQTASDLAAEKQRSARAQSQVDQLTTQVKSLGDQLTAEKKAHQEVLDLIVQLKAKAKFLLRPNPTNKNYAEESTDFRVPPQTALQSNIGSPTPSTLPGAQVINTFTLYNKLYENPAFAVLIDVLDEAGHATIPGAHRVLGVGDGGHLDDPASQKLAAALSSFVMAKTDALVFFCQGSKCWESYNAILRAERLGYRTIYWYRGGLEAWTAAGLPLE